MSCKTCEICDRVNCDGHSHVIHRLADRIAKLEAAVQSAPSGTGAPMLWERSRGPRTTFIELCQRVGPLASTGLASTESPPAAADPLKELAKLRNQAMRDYLAQDKSLDELMPSPWQVEPPSAAGPIPPGYKLAPGWSVLAEVDGTCSIPAHGRRAVYGNRKAMESACDVECAKRLGALVKVEPPSCKDWCGKSYQDEGVPVLCCHQVFQVEVGATKPIYCTPACRDRAKVEPPAEQPASAACYCSDFNSAGVPCPTGMCPNRPPAPTQGAPAEPLSARMQAARDSAVFERANAEMRRLLNCFIGEVMTLEAQLSSERERCAGIAEWWLLGNGKQGELVDAIRDGRPAPK